MLYENLWYNNADVLFHDLWLALGNDQVLVSEISLGVSLGRACLSESDRARVALPENL